MNKHFLYFFIIVAFFSCKTSQNKGSQTGSSQSVSSDSPKPPSEIYLYKNKMLEKKISTIAIPFEISKNAVEKQINANLKDLIFEDNSLEDNNLDNFMCKVWKRENISVSLVDQAFQFDVPLKIWVKAGYKVFGMNIAPKEIEFDMNVIFSSKFTILPDWSAEVHSQFIRYDWVKKPTLKLGAIELPITSFVEKALNSKQETILHALDQSIKKNIEIKKHVLQAWNSIAEPRLLSEKYKTWLKITPLELMMSPIVASKETITSAIGLQVVTETITGAKPTVLPVTNIPNLKNVTTISDNFDVAIISEIPIKEATKLATDTLVGQNFSFKDGKYNVQITDIDIYGDKERLIIKTGLKGSVNGKMYFKGIPTYDPIARNIYLKDFDYELDTKSFLVKTASWIFQGKLAKNMQESMIFPIGGQIDDIKKQIQTQLTNNKISTGAVLTGNLLDLVPDKVYMTPNQIIAVINAKGKLKLKID
ncbi:MAG: DUF4403 family protein [Pseudarcicella sp.]|nr:DUF4403 family protein [Pseudarcicella sp.]